MKLILLVIVIISITIAAEGKKHKTRRNLENLMKVLENSAARQKKLETIKPNEEFMVSALKTELDEFKIKVIHELTNAIGNNHSLTKDSIKSTIDNKITKTNIDLAKKLIDDLFNGIKEDDMSDKLKKEIDTFKNRLSKPRGPSRHRKIKKRHMKKNKRTRHY